MVMLESSAALVTSTKGDTEQSAAGNVLRFDAVCGAAETVRMV